MLKNMKNVEKIGWGGRLFCRYDVSFLDINVKGFLCNNKQLVRLIERCK